MPYKDAETSRVAMHAYYLAHREERLRRAALYAKQHPEQTKARHQRYYQKHKSMLNAKSRVYRQHRPEQSRAADRRYRANNPERCRAKNRAYHAANPERGRSYAKNRRARLKGVEATLTHEQWLLIQAHQDHRCYYCGKRCKGHLTQDHLTPLSKGGAHTLHNVIGACKSCNSRKYTGPPPIPVQPLLL